MIDLIKKQHKSTGEKEDHENVDEVNPWSNFFVGGESV